MIKREFMLKALLAAGIIILSGCATTRSALVIKDSPIKTVDEERISTTLRYLDEETLISKFGKKKNPFLTHYYTLQFKRIMVFEVKVQNSRQESIELILNRMELQFGGNAVHPTNRFQLSNFWESRDDLDETKPTDRRKKERVIKDYVLPNSITVGTGGKVAGYAVFMGNLPRYGQASVYIPLFRKKIELIHNFRLRFEF